MVAAKLCFGCVLTFILSTSPSSSDYPFRNTSLPWDERVNDLVYRLTLEELVLQIARGGGPHSNGPAPAIPRLGIKPYNWDTECLHGVTYESPATAFPQAIGLAAAFSSDLIFQVAEAIGTEARARFNNASIHGDYSDYHGTSCFAPFINILRHPLWGRNQEVYGEDPYLSGVYAANYIKGLQGNHPRYVQASGGCKVTAVHSGPEDKPILRFRFDAQVSERDLRLTYLPNFKTCIEAGSYNLMCSYNSINGVPACANTHLLTDILRNEFGFKGYFISDMGAIEFIETYHKYVNTSLDAAIVAIQAGVNLELSMDGRYSYFLNLGEAVQKKNITFQTVLERVKPLFYTRMRLGEFDPPEMNPYSKLNVTKDVQSTAHQQLAVQAAIQSFVLLKNNNTVLPLTKKYGTLALVGPMADNVAQLYGNYAPQVDLKYSKTPRQGLAPLADRTLYAAGCTDNLCTKYDAASVKTATASADVVIVCLGLGTNIEDEKMDRASLALPGYQLQLLQDAAMTAHNAPVILLLFNGGPVDISWAKTSANVHAIIECFYPAQATGDALYQVLTASNGAVPSGRLPNTWPANMDQVPPMTNYSMEGRTYRYFKGPGDPLYPFGYGLSYTQFKYYYLDIKPSTVKAGESVTVTVGVANAGPYGAKEVIQVYISWENATVPMPQLQLVGFQCQPIWIGANLLFTFTITPEQMQVWDDVKGFITQPGTIKVYAGGQQPNQKTTVGSEVLTGSFQIVA